MKLFTAHIEATQIETAIYLWGWSHAGPEFEAACLWYPWKTLFRKIYFFARHRTHAVKQLDRLNILARDLDEGRKADNLIPNRLKKTL